MIWTIARHAHRKGNSLFCLNLCIFFSETAFNAVYDHLLGHSPPTTNSAFMLADSVVDIVEPKKTKKIKPGPVPWRDRAPLVEWVQEFLDSQLGYANRKRNSSAYLSVQTMRLMMKFVRRRMKCYCRALGVPYMGLVDQCAVVLVLFIFVGMFVWSDMLAYLMLLPLKLSMHVSHLCMVTCKPLCSSVPTAQVVRNLGTAPHRGRRSAKNYLDLVNFKQAARNVDLTEFHPHFHYSDSLVKVM